MSALNKVSRSMKKKMIDFLTSKSYFKIAFRN